MNMNRSINRPEKPMPARAAFRLPHWPPGVSGSQFMAMGLQIDMSTRVERTIQQTQSPQMTQAAILRGRRQRVR